MINLPLINGRRYSFASLELAIMRPTGPAEIFIDIRSISYSDSLEITKVRGTSQMPIGWTAGQYEAGDTEIVMGKSSFQTLIGKIGHGWLGANLIINAKYADVGEPLTVDTLNCRISGASDSPANGAEELNVTLTLSTFEILRNQLRPVIR